MESLEHAYYRLLSESGFTEAIQNIKQNIINASEGSAENALSERKEEIIDAYKKMDLSIICDLLEMGYSWRDVIENYTSNPFILHELDIQHEVQQYTDSVIELVNDERMNRLTQDYDDAQRVFTSYRTSLNNKYVDDDRYQQYREYRDGEIVINMLVHDGYTEATISRVLIDNDYDEAYVKGLLEKCMDVKRLYIDISQALSLDNSKNEFDVYRSMAKEYMAKLGIKVLSYSDDLAIMQRLKGLKFPDNYLKSSFLKASPVAHEPGRNATAYVEAILSGDAQHKEFHDGLNREPVMDVEQQYKAVIELYNESLKQKGITNGIQEGVNRAYYDCLTARELFKQHYLEIDVLQAIKDFSPEKDNPAFPGYALWLLDKVKKLINKEESVLSREKIDLPLGSYKEVLAAGFTPRDIVLSILQQRIELNPSLQNKLYMPFVDKDLAESALIRYPDFDREALKGILADSPRSILLSGTRMSEEKNYVDNVIKTTEKLLESRLKERTSYHALQEKFREKQAASYQGITGETADMKISTYHVGRTALSMMRDGCDEVSLRKMIISNIPDVDEAIADDIIKQNKEVIRRISVIDKYVNISNLDGSAQDFYLARMAKQHSVRMSINASMDPEIVKDMLANNFKRSEIRDVVQQYSPIISQPGRGSDYFISYVYPTALTLLRTEQEKLAKYHPQPRTQKAGTIEEEYAYHKDQILAAIALPFSPVMDVMIAETLSVQGYYEEDIKRLLEESSPCRNLQTDYGTSILKRVENNLQLQQQEAVMEADEPVQLGAYAKTLVRKMTIMKEGDS